jgi:hypothetical protein
MSDILLNPYIKKSENYDIILKYYKLVDSTNIEDYRDLYNLYSNISIYNRCWVSYFWKNKIITFFETRFNTLNIKHSILEINFFDNWEIFVRWSFIWKKQNTDISGNFIDIFNINNWKIVYRKTDLLFTNKESDIIQVD